MEKQLRLSLGLFPPGFRFHPSDEELIVHYLHNKVTSHPLPALVIAEIDLYKFNPWELPKKALFGEDEWYFFSPRERKYPNGVRPNRAAGSGYWKATGTDKPILAFGGSKNIGVKKSLVFYGGRPPKGIKTDWIMKEYRLPDSVIKPARLKGSMRLDDWVLCRVRHKGSIAAKYEETSVFTNYLPKMETARPHIPDRSSVDHQYEDFQVMVSRLTAQSLVVATETISSISFQRSNSGTTDPPPNAETSIYNRGNTLKRPSVLEETRDEESLIQPRKKQYVGTSDEDLLSKMLVESGLEQYNQGQYQDYSFNLAYIIRYLYSSLKSACSKQYSYRFFHGINICSLHIPASEIDISTSSFP